MVDPIDFDAIRSARVRKVRQDRSGQPERVRRPRRPLVGDARSPADKHAARRSMGHAKGQVGIEGPLRFGMGGLGGLQGPSVEAFFKRFDDGDGLLTREDIDRGAIAMAARMSAFSGRDVSPDDLIARIEGRLQKVGLDLDQGISKKEMRAARRRYEGEPRVVEFLSKFRGGESILMPEELETMVNLFAKNISEFTGQEMSGEQLLEILDQQLMQIGAMTS